jgi:hypothetical protein
MADKSRSPWTPEDIRRLRQLRAKVPPIPDEEIAEALGRRKKAIQTKARELGLAFRPAHRSGPVFDVSEPWRKPPDPRLARAQERAERMIAAGMSEDAARNAAWQEAGLVNGGWRNSQLAG